MPPKRRLRRAAPSSKSLQASAPPDHLQAAAESGPGQVSQPNRELQQMVRAEVQSALTEALSQSLAPLLAGSQPAPASTCTSVSTLPAVDSAASAGTATSGPSPVLTLPSAATCTSVSASSMLPVATSISSLHGPIAAVSDSLRQRILKGEFVDLNCLLPEVLSSVTPEPIELNVSGASRAVRVVTSPDTGAYKPHARRHIHDMGTWLEAWSNYCLVLCSAAPQRATELLGYQSIIASANRQFLPEAWLSYDAQFRLAMSTSPGCRWDNINTNLWQLCFTGKARPACSACSLVHPQTSNCPFRPSRAPFSNTGPSWSRSRTADGTEICRNFNFGRCTAKECSRAHACNRCGGKHPRAKCSRSSH